MRDMYSNSAIRTRFQPEPSVVKRRVAIGVHDTLSRNRCRPR